MKTRKNNIILTGLPGSGKTTTGRALSAKTGMKFIDLDFLIEEKTGLKISLIFEKFGEAGFRKLETEALNLLLNEKEPFILSTGGGTVENNGELLKRLGKVIYLEIDPDNIFDRIKGDKTRPLLQKDDPKKALYEIFQRRKKNYETAEYRVNAGMDTEKIVDWIIYEKIGGSN